MIPKTEGIVLKSFDYRETSLIATFFTKDYGKLSGILKGIRKDPKKFGSSMDRFSVNHIVYYRYSKSDLHLISQCDLKQFFFAIRQDYKKNVAANYILELVDIIMPREEENKKVYQLMLNFLEALDTTEDIDRLVHIFQIKILLLSGFKPHLDSCVKSGRKIKGQAKFSINLGGLVSPEYTGANFKLMSISPGSILSIKFFEEKSFKYCLRLGLTKTVRRELKYILNNFLVYHLEKKIKSAKYLY